jgi:transposase
MDAKDRRIAQLEAEVKALQEQVARLTAALEEERRRNKRQAAPFRKQDAPAAEPKKPGRKKGRRHGPHAHRAAIQPEQIDEHYDVPLPDHCPHCDSRDIEETRVVVQYQTEIPARPIHRQFDIHLGECLHCGQTIHPRHELQTSDAVGAAASQLGPRAHAAMALLNKQLGLSHGKIARLFRELFGIPIARASSARSILRTARRGEPAYQTIRRDVRGSPWVVPDETGWRVGGQNAWLHAFVSETATCYEIGDRSGEVAERLLGQDWSGTLVHDGWSAYDRLARAFHQQCIGHLQRRCRNLLETSSRGAVRFPRAVLALVDRAFALRRAWRGRRLSGEELARRGLALACELEHLSSGKFTNKENRRLAKHINKHAMHWFWFLIDPSIDATNWRAEQAIRPAVVNRKVWGGNRTWGGAHAQSVLSSLLATLQQRHHDALAWLTNSLTSPTPLPLPT